MIDSGSIIDERNRKFRSISCHILHLLHLKDIVSHLIADGVESVGDFNFQTIFRQVILDKSPSICKASECKFRPSCKIEIQRGKSMLL